MRRSISTAGTSTGSRRAWITHSRTCPNASALASRAVGRSIGLIARAERIEHQRQRQRHLVEFSRSRSQRSLRGQIRGRAKDQVGVTGGPGRRWKPTGAGAGRFGVARCAHLIQMADGGWWTGGAVGAR
jgi:hypothetical protein